jgi:hypothetical protein
VATPSLQKFLALPDKTSPMSSLRQSISVNKLPSKLENVMEMEIKAGI